MKKKSIAIFFNNLRGYFLLKFLEKKKEYNLDVYLSEKNLNKSLLKKLNNYRIIKKIDLKLINEIKKKKYFLNIAAGWPLRFPTQLINSSLKGTINLHAGKLPEYRGGSPLNWQIIEGKKKIYISVIKMTKGIDTGPIYIQKLIYLKSSENIYDLHKKVNNTYPIITQKVINKIERCIQPKKQPKIKVRYMRQRKDSDGRIDWKNMTSTNVFNLVRAISKPYPGAFYFENNARLRVFKCQKNRDYQKYNPGEIIYSNNSKIIKCKIGSIKILKEQQTKI